MENRTLLFVTGSCALVAAGLLTPTLAHAAGDDRTVMLEKRAPGGTDGRPAAPGGSGASSYGSQNAYPGDFHMSWATPAPRTPAPLPAPPTVEHDGAGQAPSPLPAPPTEAEQRSAGDYRDEIAGFAVKDDSARRDGQPVAPQMQIPAPPQSTPPTPTQPSDHRSTTPAPAADTQIEAPDTIASGRYSLPAPGLHSFELPRFVYRVTLTPPERVLEQGFAARGGSWNLPEHVRGNEDQDPGASGQYAADGSVFISTTRTLEAAESLARDRLASGAGRVTIATIDTRMGNFIDVEHNLHQGTRYAQYDREQEIAAIQVIHQDEVVSARTYGRTGTTATGTPSYGYTGPTLVNDHHHPEHPPLVATAQDVPQLQDQSELQIVGNTDWHGTPRPGIGEVASLSVPGALDSFVIPRVVYVGGPADSAVVFRDGLHGAGVRSDLGAFVAGQPTRYVRAFADPESARQTAGSESVYAVDVAGLAPIDVSRNLPGTQGSPAPELGLIAIPDAVPGAHIVSAQVRQAGADAWTSIANPGHVREHGTGTVPAGLTRQTLGTDSVDWRSGAVSHASTCSVDGYMGTPDPIPSGSDPVPQVVEPPAGFDPNASFGATGIDPGAQSFSDAVVQQVQAGSVA